MCSVVILAGWDASPAQAAVALIGSAVNQDGRSSLLTAPNGPAQQEVLRAALLDSQMQPYAVSGLSMHGTGTSLGDPIEVGAALAVLAPRGRAQPLDLAASKSWVGHGEPAAGLAGLLFAQHAVEMHASRPIMHLCAVNPYVGDALRSSATQAVRLPRQRAVLASAAAVAAAVGVSAFAFQGTNAHVVVQSLGEGGHREFSAPVPWRRQRAYVLPPASLLVQSAAVGRADGSQRILLQANLAVPQLAYLWEHRVLQRCIFPGRRN